MEKVRRHRGKGTIDPKEYITEGLLENYKREIKDLGTVRTTPIIYKLLVEGKYLPAQLLAKIKIATPDYVDDMEYEVVQEITKKLK